MDEESSQLLRDVRDAAVQTRDAVLRIEAERRQYVRFEKRMMLIFFSLIAVLLVVLGGVIFWAIIPIVEKIRDLSSDPNVVTVSQASHLIRREPSDSCQASRRVHPGGSHDTLTGQFFKDQRISVFWRQ